MSSDVDRERAEEDDDFAPAPSMELWDARNRYLKRHYRNLDGVRLRPAGEPIRSVETTTGPLRFETLNWVQGLPCLVDEAAGDATVGNAIDELLTLRYSQEPSTDTAEWGRHRVRQRLWDWRLPADVLEQADEEWTAYRRTLKGVLPYLRDDDVEENGSAIGLARHGMVLALHAAVGRSPELCEDPRRRHYHLGRSFAGQLLELADPEELGAVAGMLRLAVQGLPAPSQVTRVIEKPVCGHGEPDLLLDGTLIEVKSRRGTRSDSALTGETIRQLLGYVLSVPPELEEEQPITRAGWYLARYGVLWDFPIEEIPARLYGRPLDLEVARRAFRLGIPPDEVERQN